MATKASRARTAAAKPAAKTASPTRDTAGVKRADTVAPDADDQTWVIGHDGKRVKSEAYHQSDEFRGIVKD